MWGVGAINMHRRRTTTTMSQTRSPTRHPPQPPYSDACQRSTSWRLGPIGRLQPELDAVSGLGNGDPEFSNKKQRMGMKAPPRNSNLLRTNVHTDDGTNGKSNGDKDSRLCRAAKSGSCTMSLHFFQRHRLTCGVGTVFPPSTTTLSTSRLRH